MMPRDGRPPYAGREREALLAELRGLHRHERAPAELRQRVVERLISASATRLGGSTGLGSSWLERTFAPLSNAGPLRNASVALAAFAVVASVGAAVAPRLLSVPGPLRSSGSSGSSGDAPLLTVGPEPSGEPRRTLGVDDRAAPAGVRTPMGGAELDARAPRQCPLFEVPSGAMIASTKTDFDSRASGLALHTFDVETFSCGPIARRYLELVPPGLGPKSNVPILIVLHDTGRSAEWTRRDARWRFEDVARRAGFILVYANAAPGSATNVEIGNSGSWQGEPTTHPEVDDEEYLQRIVSDLVVRHVIDGNNDVYLAGLGGGARMALTAATRQPRTYAGVAAFMPPEPQTIAPPTRVDSARLARVFIVLDAESQLDRDARALARRWAQAIGIASEPRQRLWRVTTGAVPASRLLQMDWATPASGSAAVRLLMVDAPGEPAPSAGLDRAPADPSRPRAVDDAGDAWAFLSGAESVEPPAAEAPSAYGLTADGVSVLPDDVTDFLDPPMVFDGDVLEAPAAARR